MSGRSRGRPTEQPVLGDACAILAPKNQRAFASDGQSCQQAIAEKTTAAERDRLRGVRVDDDQVAYVGDTATVSREAVTLAVGPSEQGPTGLVRQQGTWYVASD